MKKAYDFQKMKSPPDPYAAKLKRPVTIRLSDDVIGHFKDPAEETGAPAKA